MSQEFVWDYYQNEQQDVFAGSRARLEFLAKRITPRARVLNVGVGGGLFEEIAVRRGLDVFSLDPSEKAIEGLRERLQLASNARVGFLEAIPFPEAYFDAVVVSEVLEHLSDESLQRAIPEINRVLRPGGQVVGTVPDRENLLGQLVVCPECGNRFHRWGHLQSFDRERLRHLLARHFVVERLITRPFFSWSILNWKGRIQVAIRFFLWFFGIHGSAENIFFAARKSGHGRL